MDYVFELLVLYVVARALRDAFSVFSIAWKTLRHTPEPKAGTSPCEIAQRMTASEAAAQERSSSVKTDMEIQFVYQLTPAHKVHLFEKCAQGAHPMPVCAKCQNKMMKKL